MRKEAIAALLIVMMIAGAGVGYLVGNVNEHTTTIYSTTSFTQTITLYTGTNTTLTSTSTTCTNPPLIGCGPFPILTIDGAEAQVGSYAPSVCRTANFTVVCPVYIVGGDSGKVMVNVTFQGVQPGTYVGGAAIAFLVYSSAAQYVSFTSIPTCAFTSGPSLDVRGCPVPPNGKSEFQFGFSVSPSYNVSNQRWPDSVTVSMWQTCCFP